MPHSSPMMTIASRFGRWVGFDSSALRAAQSVFGKWVARATRPPRSATRRPEPGGGASRQGRLARLQALLPARPAGRRTAQAGRLPPRAHFPNTRSGGSLNRKAAQLRGFSRRTSVACGHESDTREFIRDPRGG